MAISRAEKAAYNDEIKVYKETIEVIKKKISELSVKKKKMPNIAPYYSIEIVTSYMEIINKYIKINDTSVEMLGIKNNKFLENAKSDFSKILQLMDEVVGGDINRSLKDNDEYLEKIDRLNPSYILEFINKIHRVFSNLRNRFGQESKWKWLFVDLHAKISTITKNITSFSDVAKYRDPRVEFYHERLEMFNLSKESLAESAKQYRTKYELTGRARDDIKKSIEFLSALKKIHALFGESEEANKLKITIDAAKNAMEAEDKAKENGKDKGKKKKK